LPSLFSGISESDIIVRVEAAENKITQNYEGGHVYYGQMEGGKRHGYGTITWADGEKYVGEWNNNNKDGNGTFTFADGAKYVGEFKNGKRDGNGTYTFANGDKYVGEYKNDKMDGNGTFTGAIGAKYVGEFKNDKMHGQGTSTLYGTIKHSGEWVNNKKSSSFLRMIGDVLQKIGNVIFTPFTYLTGGTPVPLSLAVTTGAAAAAGVAVLVFVASSDFGTFLFYVSGLYFIILGACYIYYFDILASKVQKNNKGIFIGVVVVMIIAIAVVPYYNWFDNICLNRYYGRV